MTPHHTHTATLEFYRDDVADSLVESVANATLNALTRGLTQEAPMVR